MYLLPQPREVTMTEGVFSIGLFSCIVLPQGFTPILRTAADQLQQDARRFAGISLDILCGASREGDITLETDGVLDPEAYRLEITPGGVCIRGGADVGVLHGVQTLRQMLRQAGGSLPCCTMEDAPCFPARGFYHDVSRGRVPTLESLKKLADIACLFKLNQLQLYVEHTYLFRNLSEVWRDVRPLTAQEILDLDAYCAGRGIELVPSLSSFGHLFELLHTKTYCHLSEVEAALPSTMVNRMRHHTLDISQPQAFELVTGMLDEFIPLFSSRKFNLCADETFDLGKGRGKKAMEAQGEKSYYIGFVRKLCGYLITRDRQPMFWGDIVAHFPEALQELPAGVICLNWDYSPQVTETVTKALADAGAVQYVCPGVIGWNQWINRLPDSYENISRMADYGRKYGAIGLLNTDWGDYGHINDPSLSIPGLIYGAVMSWETESRPRAALNEAISRLWYLDPAGKVVDILSQTQNVTVYSWWQLVHYKEWIQGTLERESPLTPVAPEALDLAGAEIRRIREQLYLVLRQMDTSVRNRMETWLIALMGIELCNEAGFRIASGEKDASLAGRMENWFRRYETLWRASSHESELWRIRETITWYADLLR